METCSFLPWNDATAIFNCDCISFRELKPPVNMLRCVWQPCYCYKGRCHTPVSLKYLKYFQCEVAESRMKPWRVNRRIILSGFSTARAGSFPCIQSFRVSSGLLENHWVLSTGHYWFLSIICSTHCQLIKGNCKQDNQKCNDVVNLIDTKVGRPTLSASTGCSFTAKSKLWFTAKFSGCYHL